MKYEFSEHIVEQEVPEGLLLLKEDGKYLVINKTGKFVWKKLRSSIELETIVSQMVELYNVPTREECEKFVSQFISNLAENGFLRESS